MSADFFNSKEIDYRYPEIAICLENTDGPYAKIFIPIVTPILSKNLAYDTKDGPVNLQNIISDTSSYYVTQCTESNYIELRLPDDKPAMQGDKFIVVFIGGDVNHPVLIGRYIE